MSTHTDKLNTKTFKFLFFVRKKSFKKQEKLKKTSLPDSIKRPEPVIDKQHSYQQTKVHRWQTRTIATKKQKKIRQTVPIQKSSKDKEKNEHKFQHTTLKNTSKKYT